MGMVKTMRIMMIMMKMMMLLPGAPQELSKMFVDPLVFPLPSFHSPQMVNNLSNVL